MDDTSHWLKTAVLPAFPALSGDRTVDVAVVGGGITGLTTAWLLRLEGLSVALVERERLGGTNTARTTAHLTAVTDLRPHDLKRHFGADGARAVWGAGMAAISLINGLVQTKGIECGFRTCPGYLHAAGADEDIGALEQEAKTARELGIPAEFIRGVPVFGVPGVMFPEQAMFHPLAYLAGLVRHLAAAGCHIFEHSPVDHIDKATRRLRTPGGAIHFNHLVFATHNPLGGLSSLLGATLLQSKLSLYSTYAIGARVPRDRLPQGLYWDTADPYRYLRVEAGPEHDYAIYGGEDHKTGQETDTAARFARLEGRLHGLAPECEIDSRWTGQVIETSDGLPFIGERKDGQYVATGYAGNGMTFGTVAGMMITDAILGRPNPLRKLFDPQRKVLRGGTLDYLRENKDYPYHLIRDRLAAPAGDSLASLAPGEGKVLEIKRRKVAAYRDPQGNVTACSAVCTHLQCIVAWNSAASTWDCPCHGSRFHPDGSVMAGPAEEPLPRLSPSTFLPLRARAGARGPTRSAPL